MHRKILAALAGGIASVVLLASPAQAVLGSAYPTKGNGPGLKNWHCVDPHSNWKGPWRYTKASTVIDCTSYNTRADRP